MPHDLSHLSFLSVIFAVHMSCLSKVLTPARNAHVHSQPGMCPSEPVTAAQAFANVVRRMMEASGRGMWNASEQTLDQLRSILNDIEDELEGVK